MNVLEFTQQFSGYIFHLVFHHKLEDGTLEYDEEYSYRGAAEYFEEKMSEYDWLFDIELTDSVVTSIKIHKYVKVCAIDIEL